MSIDTHLYEVINGFARATPPLHGVMAAYALWAGPVLLVLLLAEAWWQRARHRPDAARAVASAVLAGVGAIVAVLANQQLLSGLIARPRPCRVLPHVEVLLSCSQDYSMPSDHTMLAGALVVGLFLMGWRYGVTGLAFAVLLAFGRVYVGVHYPADTVVGLLVGAAIGAVVITALRRPTTALLTRLTHTRARSLIQAPGTTTVPGQAGAGLREHQQGAGTPPDQRGQRP